VNCSHFRANSSHLSIRFKIDLNHVYHIPRSYRLDRISVSRRRKFSESNSSNIIHLSHVVTNPFISTQQWRPSPSEDSTCRLSRIPLFFFFLPLQYIQGCDIFIDHHSRSHAIILSLRSFCLVTSRSLLRSCTFSAALLSVRPLTHLTRLSPRYTSHLPPIMSSSDDDAPLARPPKNNGKKTTE
jgi:hypothetical protein